MGWAHSVVTGAILEMAAAFSDRDSRVVLSQIAQAWLGLVERNEFITLVRGADTRLLYSLRPRSSVRHITNVGGGILVQDK